MKPLAFSLLAFSLFLTLLSTAGTPPSVNWTIDNPFGQKVFIQNKGQFDQLNNLPGSGIQYAVDDLGTRIFFTSRGLTYCFSRPEDKSSPEPEERNTEVKPTPVFVQMEWEGANPYSAIEVENKVKDYYTYLNDKDNKSTIVANAFQKLIYKNLYPNIDVVYTFHEKEGIKYSFILHPGADPSVIKMKYADMENIFIDDEGNIHLVTQVGDIIDHAPFTYYLDGSEPVNSSFILSGTEVLFHLGNYDMNKTVVIDPWTINPDFSGTNSGWDITRDGAGNIYCAGGGAPFYLKKFTSSGNLTWTFTYPNYTSWPGDFATDNAGNTYISYGAWIGTNFTKISPSGNVVFNHISGNDTFPNLEGWRTIQNCKTGALYAAGFGYINDVTQLTNIFSVDTATGDFSNYTPVYTPVTEVRSLACSPATGDIYALSVQCSTTPAAEGNRIIKLSSSLSPIYDVEDGYSVMETQVNYYPNDYGGFNGIAVGCYLFTFQGSILKRWDKNTGVQQGDSVDVPGGTELFNGGIFIDQCGSVYVGSSNMVIKYDATLNQQSIDSTSGPVYDICLGNDPGEILVCGEGFISSINMDACTQPEVSISSVEAFCACTGSATAIVNNNCELATFSFLWAPSGGTGSLATDLCPGVYSVTITDTSTCFNVTIVDSITVGGTLSSIPVITQVNSTLTSSPANSYQWQLNGTDIPGATNQSYTVMQTGLYTVIVTDSNGCVTSADQYVIVSGIAELNDANIAIYPNPSNGNFTVELRNGLALGKMGDVSIDVVNTLGQNIFSSVQSRSTVSADMSAGLHSEKIEINLSDRSTGIYFIQVKTNSFNFKRKILISKN